MNLLCWLDQVRPDRVDQFLFRPQSRQLCFDFAAINDDDAWNRRDAISRSGLWCLGYISLHDLQTAVVLLGDLVDDGSECLAGTAPRRPKVDEHGDTSAGVENVGLEGFAVCIEHGCYLEFG